MRRIAGDAGGLPAGMRQGLLQPPDPTADCNNFMPCSFVTKITVIDYLSKIRQPARN